MTKNQPKILVVEDEASLLRALSDKLTREGFAALEAKNGAEGLEVAWREHPDLILLDIIMPVMDGWTMFQKLRQNDWGKTVPVIVLTNLSADNDDQKARVANLEPAYFLVKSDWKIEDLVVKIKEVLGIKE